MCGEFSFQRAPGMALAHDDGLQLWSFAVEGRRGEVVLVLECVARVGLVCSILPSVSPSPPSIPSTFSSPSIMSNN